MDSEISIGASESMAFQFYYKNPGQADSKTKHTLPDDF